MQHLQSVFDPKIGGKRKQLLTSVLDGCLHTNRDNIQETGPDTPDNLPSKQLGSGRVDIPVPEHKPTTDNLDANTRNYNPLVVAGVLCYKCDQHARGRGREGACERNIGCRFVRVAARNDEVGVVIGLVDVKCTEGKKDHTGTTKDCSVLQQL